MPRLAALSELSLAVVFGMLVLTACGHADSPGLASQAGPSPIVLTDTSPAQLAVFASVDMGGYDATSRHKARIEVYFRHGDRPVKFVAGEQLTCNGIVPERFMGFEISVPSESIAGKRMTCAYTSGGQSTPFSFKVPPELVILSPREGDAVARSQSTTVTYSGVTSSETWVVALSTNMKAVAKPGDITKTSAKLDTSAFQVGTGSIALTDPSSFPLTDVQGAQFQSLTVKVRRATSVAVAWT